MQLLCLFNFINNWNWRTVIAGYFSKANNFVFMFLFLASMSSMNYTSLCRDFSDGSMICCVEERAESLGVRVVDSIVVPQRRSKQEHVWFFFVNYFWKHTLNRWITITVPFKMFFFVVLKPLLRMQQKIFIYMMSSIVTLSRPQRFISSPSSPIIIS